MTKTINLLFIAVISGRGVDIVELDVKTTKDGIPVLMNVETVPTFEEAINKLLLYNASIIQTDELDPEPDYLTRVSGFGNTSTGGNNQG